MDVGEVRIADDRDFERLKALADKHDGWKVEYKKKDTTVWTKSTQQTEFKMIKLHTVYKDVNPPLLFDVLMDPLYRKKWDVYMLESRDIGSLNPNNDVGYYAVRSPPPFRNRDFVLQRSWLQTDKEWLIINHSVFHESAPPKKGFVRAISYLTGLVIQPDGGCGSKLTYVTQCDPKGSLPACFVNKLTQIFAPNMAKKLRKACLEYNEWKKAHQPSYKPWLHPEQISLPRLDVSRCVSTGHQELQEDILDESLVEEQEICSFEDLDNL
uniref:START domain-containing protein 10 n=1 Tax=Rhipicephalus pulchellus TaxID=72859 RepID=L7M4M5_RHIPC